MKKNLLIYALFISSTTLAFYFQLPLGQTRSIDYRTDHDSKQRSIASSLPKDKVMDLIGAQKKDPLIKLFDDEFAGKRF